MPTWTMRLGVAAAAAVLATTAGGQMPAPGEALRQPTGARETRLPRTADADTPSPAGGEERPSILLVMIDDVGIEHMSWYGLGGPYAPTPTMEAYAASGQVYDALWSLPSCSPARGTIQTGRYPLRRPGSSARRGDDAFRLSETTIAEVLGDAGYSSGIFGKWHLGIEEDQGGLDAPRRQGYDRAVITPDNLESYTSWDWIRDGVEEEASGYITTATVDEALSWINEQVEPWFAIVAFHAAHEPWHCPPPELHPTQSCGTTLDNYRAMIEALDIELGRLLAGIETQRVTGFLTSDNGSATEVAIPPVTPDRSKFTIAQGGILVPAFAWGHGVQPGRVSGLASVADLFATIAEVAIAPLPPVMLDSVSLVPYFEEPGRPSLRGSVYAELTRAPPVERFKWHRGIRDQRYKLIRRWSGQEGFWDLDVDPWETSELLRRGLTPGEQAAYDDLSLQLESLQDVDETPVADAGEDQTVAEGTLVTLDGTGSVDPDGETLAFAWTQIAGTAVTLSDDTAVRPQFTAPQVGPPGETLRFELEVSDGSDAATDSVEVIVQDLG